MILIADISELAEHLKVYAADADITNSRCSIININIPDITGFFATRWKHGIEKIFHPVEQIIPINMNGIIFSVLSCENNNIRIVAVDVESSKDYKKRINEFISHVSHEIFMVFGLDVNISVVNTANSLGELKIIGENSTIQKYNMMMLYISRKETDKLDESIEEFFKFKKLDEWHELCNLLTHEAVRKGVLDKEDVIDDVGIHCIDSGKILKEYTCMILNRFGAKFAISKNINLLRIISNISSRYAENLSLDFIAKQTGLTSSYISHYFKQEMKESFSDFIIKVRMENAKKLLINEPDLKISNIVTMVGYESQPYFYKAFRKYEGCLPGEYRSKG